MPTIFSHAAVPLAARLGLGKEVISKPLLVAGVAASMLPDLDVLALHFGIRYADQFGHRGFSHSLMFSFGIAIIGACLCKYLRTKLIVAFLFLFIATASHGILDSFTNGGQGVALLWPFSMERYFAPVRMIQVAPLDLTRYFSSAGIAVLLSELQWVWLPCAILSSIVFYIRRCFFKHD
jgi:inner membrane protein